MLPDLGTHITDHDLVYAVITSTQAPRPGRGRWTLPIYLLRSKQFIENVETAGQKALEAMERAQEAGDEPSPQKTWVRLIDTVAGMAKSQAKIESGKMKARRENLVRALKQAERDGVTSEEEAIRAQIAELDQVRSNKAHRDRIAFGHIYKETMSTQWSRMGKDKRTRDTILMLKRLDTDPEEYTTESEEMAEIARQHHDDLQDDGLAPNDDYERAMEEVLKFTSNRADLLQHIGKETTYEEVVAAIRATPLGKASGTNGIPSELIRKLHDRWITAQNSKTKCKHRPFDVAKALQYLYNDIERNGVTEPNITKGWMCPIFKKGDKRLIQNYRPVSVLNTEYKLFTTILMKRLSPIIENIIHESQAGFIPGRSIIDQTNQAHSLIEMCKAMDQDGLIVALDQEKAFDKITHKYLWRILAAYGVPEAFINTVRSLYQDAETSVMINGHMSSTFNVRRGVRQGCPLSVLLFILAIEPLSQMLRESGALQGIRIETESSHINLIALLFADDTTVFLDKNDSIKDLFSILDLWCTASGAKFNQLKTVIIPLGSNAYRESVIQSRKTNPEAPDEEPLDPRIKIAKEGESTRILGAHVGNGIGNDIPEWDEIVSKIVKQLSVWEKTYPSIIGKQKIVQMVVGGKTQYLTAVQTMPDRIEKRLVKITREFINGSGNAPINQTFLTKPKSEGGLGLLDLKLRNDAITIVTLIKKYIDRSPKRQIWADAARVTMLKYIPPSTKEKLDMEAVTDLVLQPHAYSAKRYPRMPPRLENILTTARKYGLEYENPYFTREERSWLPAWYSIARDPNLKGVKENTAGHKCLRRKHRVKTLGELTQFALELENDAEHRLRKSCRCTTCRKYRSQGCKDPERCYEAANTQIQTIRDDLDPFAEEIPQVETPEPDERDEHSRPFDARPDKKENPTEYFRILGTPRKTYTNPERGQPRERNPPNETITVHIGSNSTNEGYEEACAGFGLWFGEGNTLNRARRVGSNLQQTRKVAELMAIREAARTAPGKAKLIIRTKSKWAIDQLTKNLKKNEDTNYIHTEHRAVTKATIAALRIRPGHTVLQKAEDDAWQEEADKLAKQGVEKQGAEVKLYLPRSVLPSGQRISTATQAGVYREIIRCETEDKTRDSTERGLELCREGARTLTGLTPTDEKVWTELWKNKSLTPKTRTYLWKVINRGLKIGDYWFGKGDCEAWATCTICDEVEDTQHILFDCPHFVNSLVWSLAKEVCSSKRISWPANMSVKEVLASIMPAITDDKGKSRSGANRLFTIVVTECAYLIWKIRCERLFDRAPGGPERKHTEKEVRRRVAQRLNERISIDRIQCNWAKYGNRSIKKDTVLKTWSGTLKDEAALPEDWVWWKTEVLVGITPKREREQG